MKLKSFVSTSFTLIELLVSIAITAIMMVFLYQSMHGINKTNQFYKTKLDEYSSKNKLVFLLYNDILLSSTHGLNTAKHGKNISHFSIKSKHSIKGFSNPFISYILFKQQKVLFRLESTINLTLPLDEESIFQTHFNRFENVASFDIVQRDSDFLMFFNYENSKEFFQISKL